MVRGSQPDLLDSLLRGSQEAAALIRVLIDTAADAYYVWDPVEDRYEYSHQFSTILGMPYQELPTTDAAVTELYHPDDRDRVFESWYKAWPDGDRWQAEYRMRRGEGSYATLDERASILHDETGKAVRLVGMVRDITLERQALDALLASRDLYEALFRESRDPALRVDLQGRVLDANEPALSWFELSPGDLGEVTLRALVPADASSELERAMTDGDRERPTKVEVVDRSGSRHLLVSAAHCRTTEGEAVFLLGTDITESCRLRDELQASELELRARTESLAETNTALRVILDQRDRDRRELEDRVVANMQELVLPILDDVQRSIGPGPQAIRLDGLRDTLEKVTVALLPKDVAGKLQYPQFTRREAEIAALIRAGKTTKEIAEAMFLAPSTVTSHRRNMRRKLSLEGPGSRLSNALVSHG